MNGKVSRRIARAAWHVMHATGSGESHKAIRKQLKREYKDQPYHKRQNPAPAGYRILSHAEQEIRWHYCSGR